MERDRNQPGLYLVSFPQVIAIALSLRQLCKDDVKSDAIAIHTADA